MGRPNILVTGTPGTGKTKLCQEIAKLSNFKHIDVSALSKAHNFIESYDEHLECPIIDEDKVLDYLEPIISDTGGNIVEYHSCELFPERWFNVIYVTTCDNTILYDRLKERDYNEQKIRSNIDCEIFQTIFAEAMDSYDCGIVHKLYSENDGDFKENVDKIMEWIKSNDK